MERKGAIALLPAPLSETPRSEGPKKYIRNVEAEGSNPFTSTGMIPGQGWFSNEERYNGFVEVVAAVKISQSECPVHGTRAVIGL
jgi:hypothetical protein